MKKSKLKIENARMKRNGYKFRRSDTEKFKLWPREGLYGHWLELPEWKPETVALAKKLLYVRSYLYLKVRLKRFAGVDLGEPKWIEKEYAKSYMLFREGGSVGWKAKTDKPVGHEAYRRMDLAEKRARMQINGKKSERY